MKFFFNRGHDSRQIRLSVPLPVLRRRKSSKALEDVGEVLQLTEPVSQRHVGDAVFSQAELTLGLRDASLNDVAIRRRSEGFLKCPLEMPFAQPNLVCQML